MNRIQNSIPFTFAEHHDGAHSLSSLSLLFCMDDSRAEQRKIYAMSVGVYILQ